MKPLSFCLSALFLLASAAPVAADSESRLYPDVSRAPSDVAAAIQTAGKQGRRVLVDFGGNWCGDCKVLDANFHRPENLALLRDHYVLVHVNVGEQGIDHNADLAARYGIPLAKGVPALAVLDGQGHVVFSQKNGEFESMRRVDPVSVHEFLERWKN
jgi:thiol:disulfide interchange protein